MNIIDDQYFDPLDESVEADYEEEWDGFPMPAKKVITKAVTQSFSTNKSTIILIKNEVQPEPGMFYLNYSENRAEEGKHWISSKELFNLENKFALLNAGKNSWGMKMYPDQFKTGFENYYHRYGGVGNIDFDYDNEALVYLVRFHNHATLAEFKNTSWNIPLHHFAPIPHSTIKEEIFSDNDNAQIFGWRKQFEGSGFTDQEILGIVNTHHNMDRMELLFLKDINALNIAYKCIGGQFEKDWLLRQLKDNELL